MPALAYTDNLIKHLADVIIYLNADYTIDTWNAGAEELLQLSRKQRGEAIDTVVKAEGFTTYLNDPKDPFRCTLVNSHGERTLVFILLPWEKSGFMLIAKDMSANYRLDRVRQDFVANVSHELRTPLTVIHGYLEALLDHSATENGDMLNVLGVLQQQTVRMKNLVEDLLLLSRLEGQSLSSDSQQLAQVPQLLQIICKDAASLSNNQHRFILDIDPELYICGKTSELRSAFSNLAVNAVRYTPKDGVITIRWYQDKTGIHFVVEDTGPGIEQKHIPRLTERFYRVDKGRSRDVGGTGLGLAIVKHVLLRHQGRLRIKSQVGVGSKFRCSFPLPKVS